MKVTCSNMFISADGWLYYTYVSVDESPDIDNVSQL